MGGMALPVQGRGSPLQRNVESSKPPHLASPAASYSLQEDAGFPSSLEPQNRLCLLKSELILLQS